MQNELFTAIGVESSSILLVLLVPNKLDQICPSHSHEGHLITVLAFKIHTTASYIIRY